MKQISVVYENRNEDCKKYRRIRLVGLPGLLQLHVVDAPNLRGLFGKQRQARHTSSESRDSFLHIYLITIQILVKDIAALLDSIFEAGHRRDSLQDHVWDFKRLNGIRIKVRPELCPTYICV